MVGEEPESPIEQAGTKGDGTMIVSGKELAKIADQIQTIVAATATLSEYHRERRQALTRE